MGVYQHLTEFAGLPVAEFDFETEEDAELPPAAGHAWAVRTSFDEESFEQVWSRFRAAVDTTAVTALVIGYWGASYDEHEADPVALLTEAAADFPALRALFLGDITGEEAEISWIEHSDITPLFTAFPELERFEIRGADGNEGRIRLEPIKSTALKRLRFESGGLPARIVRAVAASDLPNLEHLDLWLGTDTYGGDATMADLEPILTGERLPSLRHLGLEDSETQDQVAEAVAGAPVVARLESLSLAMGILTDAGAEALLSGQPLTHLRRLDLHHHYLGDTMMDRLRAALPGVDLNLDDRQETHRDGWRFIAVSE
ncbi:STM4015 family protein [Actinomadura kijaniata]|uniref:STM4015 family protein n=1 Tax=Actinomadura kijaniata TaxID=46161 RepID=UPI00083785A0|nr:STM4015 family protein [Actinomadura kijaniata]